MQDKDTYLTAKLWDDFDSAPLDEALTIAHTALHWGYRTTYGQMMDTLRQNAYNEAQLKNALNKLTTEINYTEMEAAA